MDEKKMSAEEKRIEDYKARTDNNVALDELEAYIHSRRQGYGEVWSTGFSNLDAMLDGGFLGEQLIVLGAVSSLGKTSFALQVATQLAEHGKDVLIFSLEMSKNELNAKTISRYTHIQTAGDRKLEQYRLTTRDILSGNVGEHLFNQIPVDNDERARVFSNALAATRKIAGNVRICVGDNKVTVDTIGEEVENHYKATGKKPFVVIDYLQILKPSDNARTQDKRLLTDYDITTLKVLARTKGIPVFVISAFNRASYLDPVSTGSFKESSGIEYSSDVLLGMQYFNMDYQKHPMRKNGEDMTYVYESQQEHDTRVRDLLNAMDIKGKAGEPLIIELKVLKNRNGAKGSVYFNFLPKYNYYAETDVPLQERTTTKRSRPASSPVASSSSGIVISDKVY